jgi:hypothetical protein
MYHTILFTFNISLFLCGPDILNAQSLPQSQLTLTPGAVGVSNAAWVGEVGRTYFIARSLDLVTWSYAPVVEFGIGAKSKTIANAGAAKFFVRIHYVDDTTVTTLQQARDADFDSDGIPNAFEVETLGSDPLDKNSAGGDISGNGLPDGWELFHFGNLTTANPSAILKPDGLTNQEKADLGLNPNVDYSSANAPQPSSFSYDLTGRLTGVTAPVGTAAFTPDEEGNLTNAQ